jgi:hypothetical protein
MDKWFNFLTKICLTPNFCPCQGGKIPPKMPHFRVKTLKQGDNAPENAPNLMYDGFLEAYGQAR